ncbi:cytochrome P450 [Kutzneria sp. NPDC052558]|uniref:cytochrome P450 n=1 Tax=Kutzneria sp. NPDC052558 TaxID=3364121 RepID=UPI0037C9A328
MPVESLDTATDFGDVALYADGHPFAVLDRLREAAPVHRLSSPALGHDFWGIFRAEHARKVLADDRTFVSGVGVFPWNGPHNPDPLRGSILIASDGERRAAVRGAMKGLFARNAVESWRDTISATLTGLLTPHLAGAVFDFGAEVAWPAAMAVMAELVGLPADQALLVGDQVAGILGDTDMADDVGRDRAQASGTFAHVAQLLDDAVTEQIRVGATGLIAALDQARTDGVLSRRDVLSNLIGVIVGGTEAPRLVLTGVAFLLARESSWLDRLRRQPALRAGFVEEALRWTAPTTMVGRTVAHDVVLADRRLRAGDVVRVMLAAAVRDPRLYRDPHVFDPARTERAGFAFGHGPHHCVGAAVARAQVTALLEVLLRLDVRPTVAGPPVAARSNAFAGWLGGPMTLNRANREEVPA